MRDHKFGCRIPLARCTALFAVVLSAGLSGPAGAENLIANSSFEAGIDYKITVGRWYVDGIPSAKLDSTSRVHGAHSLRIPFSRRAYATAPVTGIEVRSAVPVTVVPGRRQTFSVYLRSDPPSRGRLVLTRNSVNGHRHKPSAQREVFVTRTWQRFSVTYRPAKSEEIYWSVSATSKKKGHLWIDAAQLAAGLPRDYQTARPIEAALSSDRLARIFAPDETPTVTLGAYNGSGVATKNRRYAVDVFDESGKRLVSKAVGVTVGAGQGQRVAIALPVRRRGLFRAEVRVAGAPAAESELLFSVLPRPRKVPPERSAFGAYTTVAPEPLGIMRRIGFPWIGMLTANTRMNYWNVVEPKQGKFLWYDDDVDRAMSAGFRFMFTLEPCRTPRWASRYGVAERRQLWLRYVRAMVGHYGDRVKYWTIGDEVHDVRKKSYKRNCWTNPAEYAAWHRAGYRAIKSVKSDAVVILNSWAGFTRKLFKVMDPKFVDVLGANGYHAPSPHLQRMKAIADRHGIARRWAPGIGYPNLVYYRDHIAPHRRSRVDAGTWHRQTDSLLRGAIATFSLGYERIFHYTANYVGTTNRYSIFEADSALSPLGVQLGALAWLVDGFETAAEVPMPDRGKNVRVHRFDRLDGVSVFAVLSNIKSKQRMRLPGISAGGMQLFDDRTNPLRVYADGPDTELRIGGDPVFLKVPKARADAVARAFARSTHRIDGLPKAKSKQVRGNYAVLRGLSDGVYRRNPNISLWYRSARLGWTEVLRYRASSIKGTYRPLEDGFEITWNIPATKKAFYLGPGAVPIDLIEGATIWQAAMSKGRRIWSTGTFRAGQPLKLRKTGVEPKAASVRPSTHHVIGARNGLKIAVGTRSGSGRDGGMFPGWKLLVKGKQDAFFHRYFRAAEKSLRLTTTIRVAD